MARKVTKTKTPRKTTQPSRVTVEKADSSNKSLLDKLQYDLQNNQSYLNLILGALIIIVLGVLIYNYFTKPEGTLGPSQQTNTQTGDVTKENLPGKYTIKEGDTLFSIAQKYYDDGYKYPLISEANKLTNENTLNVGQVLEIPKPAEASSSPAAQPSESPAASLQPSESPSTSPSEIPTQETNTQTLNMGANEKGAGGTENQSIWGEKITSNTYTVQPGDWLSKIAARAYGDVFAYTKIAQANNIQNPDSIEVGQVLKIPR